MIIAILVLLVASLLMAAAFTAANGDVTPAHLDLTQKQAYYAALAGIQEYEYKLEANPDYWESCPTPSGTVPGESSESFEVTTLAASSDPESAKTCNASAPFTTIIESKGALQNTFRIKSTGKAGKTTREVVANFQVAGFLNYIYFTQYEDRDPQSHAGTKEEEEKCPNYRKRREEIKALTLCGSIEFAEEDSVNGPMHTDDAAVVCGGAEFGRKGHEPRDVVEIDGGPVSGGCGSGEPIYNTVTGKPDTEGEEIVAPESDGSLHAYVEREPTNYEFTGRTTLELEGAKNEIHVTTLEGGKSVSKWVKWPENGLIYVSANPSSGCKYVKFTQEATDTSTTYKEEENCGSVYVKGTYAKSLTIAAEQDLVINGSITPYGVTPPAAPPGTVTLGLIATRFIRIYHPCSSNTNQSSGPAGSYIENPWIYGAILSTSHSFLVDNFNCGSHLGDLNVYGAIGQKFRGIVGEGSSGFTKEYIYDERLATDEPPYFLAPLKAGWKIARETLVKQG